MHIIQMRTNRTTMARQTTTTIQCVTGSAVHDSIHVTNEKNLYHHITTLTSITRQPRVSSQVTILGEAHHKHQACTDSRQLKYTSSIIYPSISVIFNGLRLKEKTCYGHNFHIHGSRNTCLCRSYHRNISTYQFISTNMHPF